MVLYGNDMIRSRKVYAMVDSDVFVVIVCFATGWHMIHFNFWPLNHFKMCKWIWKFWLNLLNSLFLYVCVFVSWTDEMRTLTRFKWFRYSEELQLCSNYYEFICVYKLYFLFVELFICKQNIHGSFALLQ